MKPVQCIYTCQQFSHFIYQPFTTLSCACENYEVERQRHNKQINYTQDSSFFPRKNKELSWVGFEPTTLCSLGERSTMHKMSARRVSAHLCGLHGRPKIVCDRSYLFYRACFVRQYNYRKMKVDCRGFAIVCVLGSNPIQCHSFFKELS